MNEGRPITAKAFMANLGMKMDWADASSETPKQTPPPVVTPAELRLALEQILSGKSTPPNDPLLPVPVPALRNEEDRVASAMNLLEIARTDTLPHLDKDKMRQMGLMGRAEYLLGPSRG